MPIAPASSWRQARSGHLWFLKCGRSFAGTLRKNAAMRSRLASIRSRSRINAGVSISSRVIASIPEDRRFRYRGAISTRVGSAIVNARCGIVHNRLPRTEEVGVVGAHIHLVAPGGKLLTDSSRNTLLDPHLTSARVRIHESRGIERLLDIHPEIDNVGDELSVRLGLVPAADDAEADVHVALLHERRNNRMERPHSGFQGVGPGRVQGIATGPIVQMKASSFNYDARPEGAAEALNDG